MSWLLMIDWLRWRRPVRGVAIVGVALGVAALAQNVLLADWWQAGLAVVSALVSSFVVFVLRPSAYR